MKFPESVPYVSDYDNADLPDEFIKEMEKSFGKGISKPKKLVTRGISLKNLKKISE